MVQHIKRELKTLRGKVILVLSVIFLTFSIWIAMDTITQANSPDQNIRIIAIEIKDMVFGNNNPDIYLLPGETVRFVITNLDPGMTHEFKINGTDVKTRALEFGEQDSILFQAPKTENDMMYICSWHSLTMRGNLLVRSEFPSSLNIAFK